MESGYGRCEDATGAVETVGVEECAYDEGVIVLVLGVELVGVKLELALERTDGDGEPTIAESIISMMFVRRNLFNKLIQVGGSPRGSAPTYGFAGRSMNVERNVERSHFRISGLSVVAFRL